jgi:Cellulase (glycosyl hydrolase family 5)
MKKQYDSSWWRRAGVALAAWASALGGASSSGPVRAAEPATRLSVSGAQLLAPDGRPIWLHGFNWGRWGTAMPEDGKGNVERGANVVRIPFRWNFTGPKADIRQTSAPGHFNPEGLKHLDDQIKWATDAGLWVVLFAGSDQGAGDNRQSNYWNDPALKREFMEAWAFIVQRYKDTPRIAAYELLSEPHPKKPVTTADLRKLYEALIANVRRYDNRTPLVIGADDHYDINQLQGVYTRVDDKLIYAANFYLPTEYCKPWRRFDKKGAPTAYPGSYVDRNGVSHPLDKQTLAAALRPALDFRERNKVPVFIDQVGCFGSAPGVLDYTRDVLALFKANQLHYAFWTYRAYNAGPLEHGLWYNPGDGWKLKPELDKVLRAAMAP